MGQGEAEIWNEGGPLAPDGEQEHGHWVGGALSVVHDAVEPDILLLNCSSHLNYLLFHLMTQMDHVYQVKI